MRFFINAMLAFAFVAFFCGFVPVSAQRLMRLHAMKMELASAQSPELIHLRASFER
jgi:hypothetical protein